MENYNKMVEKTKIVTQNLKDKLKDLIDNPNGIDNRNTFGLQSLLINQIHIFEQTAEDYDPLKDDNLYSKPQKELEEDASENIRNDYNPNKLPKSVEDLELD